VRPRVMISAVDVHAEGEPGRVLLASSLQVRGQTMAERLHYCRTNLDWLRRLMLQEPRGYPAMCCNLVVPPSNPAADAGLIVMEQSGFNPMSGSNTMCVVTALLETGALPAREPVTTVVLETAVGLVEAEATVTGTKVERVKVRNVPAFVVRHKQPLEVPELGRINVDVAFGGQFFVLASAADAKVSLEPSQAQAIARAGALIKAAAQDQIPVSHPLNPAVNKITLTMLYGPSGTLGVAGRNTVICTTGTVDPARPQTCTGSLDRSPCGTGTCARMAVLEAEGSLKLGQEYVHEGILGTTFTGELISYTRVGEYRAVVPTISGRAWITGIANYVLDEKDPFPEGYVLGDIWAGEAVTMPERKSQEISW
jgi:proline racemase